jgi:hypothetical protein
MTNLKQACLNILLQLSNVVEQIESHDFSKPSLALGKSTIGQHLRHTLEFFLCFQNGFQSGVINYDKRAHNRIIETNKSLALEAIHDVANFISGLKNNCSLVLEVGYDLENDESTTLETNASRELVYNIEHAVHHMAIMKIGIREVAPYINVPESFGIAASTIRYQETIRIR